MDPCKLLQKYPNVSPEELGKIWAISHYPSFSEILFERRISSLDRKKEEERLNGRGGILVGPLVQVISVQFLSAEGIDRNKYFTAYGRIYAEFHDSVSGKNIVHDFFRQDKVDAQVLESNDCLALISPGYTYSPFKSGTPLDHTKLVIDVYIGDRNISTEFWCGNHEADVGKDMEEHIYCDLGCLVFRYSVIPFAVRGHVLVHFSRKEGYPHGTNNYSLDVKGSIVARSSDSLMGYTLFHKKSDEFERVDTAVGTNTMNLSRCWVGVSAYSSLIIDVDLYENGTEREILKRSIELQVRGMASYDAFIVGDLIINLTVIWISPMPHGGCIQEGFGMLLDDESSSDEISSLESDEEDSDDEQMNEACIPIMASDFSRPRKLRAHQDIPLASCALQIYPIFIGREKLRALHIHGFIKVSSPPHSYYIFNKEVGGAYDLVEHSKTVPVENGCGAFDDSETLKIDFDLKDINSHLEIRGHVTWHWSSFDVSPGRIDRLLCSIVQGVDGFAAIHYSLFSEAVQAEVEVSYKTKNEHAHVSPKVFGSLVACYNNCDYTPRYNKDYYRICLFERNQKDPAQVGTGGGMSLARNVVVVPLGSSLVVEADLFDAAVPNEGISGTLEFLMGCSDSMVLEGGNHCIYVHVKWGEVGN